MCVCGGGGGGGGGVIMYIIHDYIAKSLASLGKKGGMYKPVKKTKNQQYIPLTLYHKCMVIHDRVGCMSVPHNATDP